MRGLQHDKAAADKASKEEATSAPPQQEGQGPPPSHTDLSDVAASTASAIGGIAADTTSAPSPQVRYCNTGSGYCESSLR